MTQASLNPDLDSALGATPSMDVRAQSGPISESALWIIGLTATALVLAAVLLLSLLARNVVADASLSGFVTGIALMIAALGIGALAYALTTARRQGLLSSADDADVASSAVPPGMYVVPARPAELGHRKRQELQVERSARKQQASAIAAASALKPPPARPAPTRPVPAQATARPVATRPAPARQPITAAVVTRRQVVQPMTTRTAPPTLPPAPRQPVRTHAPLAAVPVARGWRQMAARPMPVPRPQPHPAVRRGAARPIQPSAQRNSMQRIPSSVGHAPVQAIRMPQASNRRPRPAARPTSMPVVRMATPPMVGRTNAAMQQIHSAHVRMAPLIRR